MDFQNMAANTVGSYEYLQLEPFIHQVGGHSSMLQLDPDTICKPQSQLELNFYKTAPESLREFMAEYKGSIEVKFSEADDGYLDVTAYSTAPTTGKIGSGQTNERKANYRIRLSEPGNLLIDSIVYDELKQNYEESNRGKAQNGSLNPWVLRCHQKQMKKKLQNPTTTFCQRFRSLYYQQDTNTQISMGND